ncbi:MAG: hypothetical protein ABI968_10180 [Acidobacteriota bacterium]
MRTAVAFPAIAYFSSVLAADPSPERPIYLIFLDRDSIPQVLGVHGTVGQRLVADAIDDLGLWKQDFIVQFSDELPGQIKIEERMETSVSVMGEGPHVDLTEWRHHQTPWKELTRVGENRWRSATFNEAELASFPSFTIDELKEQVRRVQWIQNDPQSLKFWLERAEHSNSTAVGLSRVYLKISYEKAGQWVEHTQIEIPIPMGC